MQWASPSVNRYLYKPLMVGCCFFLHSPVMRLNHSQRYIVQVGYIIHWEASLNFCLSMLERSLKILWRLISVLHE